jgi:hypothetical protein
MRRKFIIAFVILAVTVLPLTATCTLAADGTQQPTHTYGRFALPFAGSFSGKSLSPPGGISDTGTGVFMWCGWSKVTGHQTTGTQSNQPYYMTITTLKGTISLQVQPGGTTYQIDKGTGCFAHVVGGSGHFSLHRSSTGTFTGTFTGYFDGTIIFA